MVEYQISKLFLEVKIYFCFKKEFFPLDSHDAKRSNDIYDDKQYITDKKWDIFFFDRMKK